MERDYIPDTMLPLKGNISTHTLTWSVTTVGLQLVLITKISTHTLTWSVTAGDLWGRLGELNFNSHAHVERDHPALNQKRNLN